MITFTVPHPISTVGRTVEGARCTVTQLTQNAQGAYAELEWRDPLGKVFQPLAEHAGSAQAVYQAVALKGIIGLSEHELIRAVQASLQQLLGELHGVNLLATRKPFTTIPEA